MRKITAISNIGESIGITLNDGESAIFHNFAKTIYTQTSPGVLKKTLSEFKKDIVKFNWNVNELRRLWL